MSLFRSCSLRSAGAGAARLTWSLAPFLWLLFAPYLVHIGCFPHLVTRVGWRTLSLALLLQAALVGLIRVRTRISTSSKQLNNHQARILETSEEHLHTLNIL